MNKRIESFEDLFVWQQAIQFAKEIYLLTDRDGFQTDFGLKNQLRRSSISISSNIAEGFERRSRNEYLNFLNIAKGSAGEARSQLHLAREIGYLKLDEFHELKEKAKFLSGALANQINAIRNAEKK